MQLIFSSFGMHVNEKLKIPVGVKRERKRKEIGYEEEKIVIIYVHEYGDNPVGYVGPVGSRERQICRHILYDR